MPRIYEPSAISRSLTEASKTCYNAGAESRAFFSGTFMRLLVFSDYQRPAARVAPALTVAGMKRTCGIRSRTFLWSVFRATAEVIHITRASAAAGWRRL